MNYWMRVKALFRRKQLDRELEEEMAFHLAMLEEANRERGASGVQARREANRRFGNVTRTKEISREMWSFPLLEGIWMDLRYGARTLAKNPGFTTVAALAIALGIGVNTGIFSVLNGVGLKLLPVPRAEQIVGIDQTLHGKVRRNMHGEPDLFSYSEYENYRRNNHVFSGMLAYEPFLQGTLGGGPPQQLMGAATSCNYFGVLGERPALGRTFVDEDCRAPGASAVVVLSDELWKKQFGGDPSVIRTDTHRIDARTAVRVQCGFTGLFQHAGNADRAWTNVHGSGVEIGCSRIGCDGIHGATALARARCDWKDLTGRGKERA